MGTINVWIVDDDKVYQVGTRKILEKLGFPGSVKVFSDGKDAFQHISENMSDSANLPDVIFLDINMPLMDGWAFLEAFAGIKSLLSKVSLVYIVSSSVSASDIERAVTHPEVKEYCIKPVAISTFSAIIEDALQIQLPRQ